MTAEATILKEISSLKREIKQLKDMLVPVTKTTWGTAADLKGITGWTDEQLRKHRDQNTIQFKCIKETKRKKVFRYNIASVPQHYIKSTL